MFNSSLYNATEYRLEFIVTQYDKQDHYFEGNTPENDNRSSVIYQECDTAIPS